MNPVMDPALERAHAVIREFVGSRQSRANEDPGGLLEMLELALPPHFAYEERAGGFLSELRANGVPEKGIERLLADHSEALSLLGDARRTLDGGGPGVDAKLDLLAKLMRAHEWLESASAARLGVQLPPGRSRDEAARALPRDLADAVDELAGVIEARVAATRDAFLASVSIALPSSAPIEAFLRAFEHALSLRGLDFVDVDAVQAEGSPRILSTRFDPGWS
jgi:hypothetical protein